MTAKQKSFQESLEGQAGVAWQLRPGGCDRSGRNRGDRTTPTRPNMPRSGAAGCESGLGDVEKMRGGPG